MALQSNAAGPHEELGTSPGNSTIVEVNRNRLEAARAVAGFANSITGAHSGMPTGQTEASLLFMSGNIEDLPGLQEIAAVIAAAMQTRAGYTSTRDLGQVLSGRIQKRRASRSRPAATGSSTRSPAGEVADVDVQLQFVCNETQHAILASLTDKGQAYMERLTGDQARVPEISSLFIQSGRTTVIVRMRFFFPSPKPASQGIPPAKFLQIIGK